MSLPDLETRIAIVNYRIENAVKTLDEARHQIQNGDTTIPLSTECITLAITRRVHYL